MIRADRERGLGRQWQGCVFALFALLLTVGSAHAQTNPVAQTLPYTQDFSALAASSTTYPAGWQGWTNGTVGAAYLTTGPILPDMPLVASGTAASTTGGLYNYNGKIGPLNSGTSDIGLALAINTTGFAGVVVSYEVATIRNPYDGTTNTRINEISLQYRVGTAGAWTTLAGTAYQNNTTAQTTGTTPQNIAYRSAVLPATCDNQAVVQLRWAQLQVSGAGSRPSFAIDNMAVQQPPAGGQATALAFDGVNDYVTFGQAPSLALSNFTVETWFKRTGLGVVTSTGAGPSGTNGLVNVVPLVSKGRGEGDGGLIDCNYFLGLQNTPNVVLVADYEHNATSANNHALVGTTLIQDNVWYHAAASYDGSTLRIYLNGNLEAQVAASPAPSANLIQHAGLGTAMTSVGATQGAFQGQLDEARIWNVARSACDIFNSANLELTSGTGLVARWGMSDGAGSVLSNSLATPNGILMNGPTWVTGSPFNAATNPAPPTGLNAVALSATQVQLTWTDNATSESGYEVERSTSGAGGPFTLRTTLAANATTFTDTPLSASTQYCYQVRAISTCAAPSAYTAVACATTPAPSPPNAPTGLSATAVTYSQVNLAWTDNATDETSFEVERSTDGGTNFSPLVTLGANVTSYSNIGLSATTQYCYRVRATNANGGSGYTLTACATTPAFSNMALDFAGSTYVTFGDPNALDLAQFTIECWFKRDGTGTPNTTGTDGITDAIPLVTHGAPQAEGGVVDMNFMLGFASTSGVLCADFEEGPGGAGPLGQNHPVLGRTPVGTGWHHGAATYDGVAWKLYLDGILEGSIDVGQPVASNTTQRAALATMLTSTGGPLGYLDGRLDEVRIWNYARTQEEIRSTANTQITSAQTGLVARWSLDEGSGTAVGGSAGTNLPGTITGANYTWVTPGGSYDLTFNDPPLVPTLVAPPDAGTGVSTSPSLQVSVSDPEASNLTVTYYGRLLNTPTGPDFTVIAWPDVQYYTAQTNGGNIATLDAQNNWIVARRAARNIVYSVGLGDCTDTNTPAEWTRASNSFGLVENTITTGLPEGIPYGLSVGNHDQTPNGDPAGTANYNAAFGSTRFAGRSYYGGHYGTDNDNWYETFSASGMDFIVVSLEYNPAMTAASPELVWANNLLATNSTRRAIVVSHFISNTGNPGGFGPQGQQIYNALKGNPNLFLLLCGHVPGEGRRQDTFNGNTVHTLLADYQSRTAGGNGWLRILEFSPANNVIRVRTYSPTLDQFEADADSSSQFTLGYSMSANGPFQALGTVSGVSSGSTASLTWPGLAAGTQYEWYATVSDGNSTTTGPIWSFTTAAAANYTLTTAANPVAGGSVAKSPDQATYAPATPVQLTATPAPGYRFTGWSGDAGGTSNPVTVTMDANKSVTANFAVFTPIATLAASQVRTGNDGDGTIKLRLHWDDVPPVGATVKVYRARHGQYPEYDDVGGGEPSAPAWEPTAPWELTAVTASDGTDEVNNVVGYDGRDTWYYVAFIRDAYGVYSSASNVTVGRPNYLLGDVADGTPEGLGRGNNVVSTVDISKLGDSYGASGVDVAPVAYLDVGPTQDYSVATRPRTDNVLDFEDLVMFALNFDITAVPQLATASSGAPVAVSRGANVAASHGVSVAGSRSSIDRMTLESPERVTAGQEFTVRLHLEGSGRVQALSAALRWPAGVVEPVGVEAGEWVTQLGGVAFSPRPGVADVALLGARGSGFDGEGVVAEVRFRAIASGEPQVTLAAVQGRDGSNRKVEIATSVLAGAVPRPTTTELSAAFPNPFEGTTTIAFSLADKGPAAVSIYGVDGRAVRTLASGPREPGLYRLPWDGRNDSGQLVGAGIYFVQLTTAQGRSTRRVAFLR